MPDIKKHWAKVVIPVLLVAAIAAFYRDAIFGTHEVTVEYAGGKVHLVQADRRAIFVFHERGNAGFACPEPSPDVRANVERAVRALGEAQASVPKGEGTPQVKSSVDATNKVLTDALMERTQGLQVLRDMLFQACLANIRGDMSGVQYVSFVSATLPKLTTSLIATELVTRQGAGAIRLSGTDLQTFLNFLVLNSQ